MNILLVDDEITMLQILKTVVPWEKLGIKGIYAAKNAAEARQIFEEKKIDLVLCDIEMPKENGLDLIKWIQGLYPGVINIILTGHADFNYARSAVSLGVYEFLLKPVAFEELEQVLKHAVEQLEKEMIPGDVVSFSESEKRSELADSAEKIKNYLEVHYNEVITRNDIEKQVHLNQDYINRLFKAYTGYTLMEYIQYYRISMAKKMLRESVENVAEIGTAVGYDSPAYFSKIFKKQTGMTPVEYRQKSVLL